MTDLSQRMARGLWTLYEPIHALTYFAPEASTAFADAGPDGFWRGYFAGRSAPLGAVDAAPVVALFAGFAPSMVERALPAVWTIATPARALAARRIGAAAALRAHLAPAGQGIDGGLLDRLEAAATGRPVTGRVLAAANAALPANTDGYERLWQATTTLREWRGDAHVAALVSHGLTGLDILVLRCLVDQDRPRMQAVRGWSDSDWERATDRLTGLGLISPADPERVALSDTGTALIREIERVTDKMSAPGTTDQMLALARLLAPIARACAVSVPQPNPIGVGSAWDPIADPGAELISGPV